MSKKWTETEIVLLKNCIEDGYTLVRIQEQFFQNGYKRTVGSLIGDLTKVDVEIRKTVDNLTKNVGMVNRRVTVYRNRNRLLWMVAAGLLLLGGVLYVIG